MAVCLMKGMKLPEEEKIHMHQCYDRKRRRDEAEDLQEATRKQLRIN